ncbi:MAG: RecQ family ATP-dependent DNA helicase [Bacteroidales bacterium]|nr:RecQ family ATP-dependent DNA helicase [Bacteroidales bacterium]
MKERIRSILLKYWGYTSFRPLQEDVIFSILSGKDTVALFPTGGGKSITYQVPALVMDGFCLVVTPLIALMLDQVDQLKKRGIHAEALHSGLSYLEAEEILRASIDHKIKLLYVSPERLTLSFFREALREMRISFIAVDEAHCISQWGYDFRPAYLRIAEIRPFKPEIPILAVTGSATQRVLLDIVEKLSLKQPHVVRQSFFRPNLFYNVLYEENKTQRLLQLLNEYRGSGIVYIRDRKKTQQWADFLKKSGIDATFYHAGLPWDERKKRQQQWIRGHTRVMVSTNAFGMGIDKPDVRVIVHLDMPDSIEAYFQEAGRAGRDGKDAYAWLLWNYEDISKLDRSVQENHPDFSYIGLVYHRLGEFFNLLPGTGENASFPFDLQHFIQQENFQPREAFYALKQLHHLGLISLSDPFFQRSRAKILLDKRGLYKFQVEEPQLNPFLEMLIRTYVDLFDHFVFIDEDRLAKQMNTTKDIIIKGLMLLRKKEIIAYEPVIDSIFLTFLTPRLKQEELISFQTQYEKLKQKRHVEIQSMKTFVLNMTKCRSQFLLSYFGEEKSKRCGQCDVCAGRGKLSMSDLEFDELLQRIKPLLEEPRDIYEIFMHFPAMRNLKVISALRWLLDHGKIESLPNGKLRWKKKLSHE